MAKITKSTRDEQTTIKVKTKQDGGTGSTIAKWWLAKSKRELCNEMLSTATFLKEAQQYRYRQAGIYARLYGNMPLYNFVGSTMNKMNMGTGLPIDRPTMNVVQSCIDTLVSRITQSRPAPEFLTDDGDYKERNLAKQLNSFIAGELYQTKAYRLGELMLRDASVLGTGCLKIYENSEKRVALERVIQTELLVDPNDAYYGDPRQLFQIKLVDRDILEDMFPAYRSDISKAEQAYPDNSADANRTVSDQVMVVEAWHLPSSKNATDGRHTIACSEAVLSDEIYTKQTFPFVFLHSSSRLAGFWGQGTAERLMGTQVQINELLMTISASIKLVGVPRVFVEDGSKVVKAHLNNNVGAIVTYQGTKPQYEVAPCIPQEVYAQLQRLIDYAYQQEGVSMLNASAQKPAGLNSGEAIRSYDDLQTDRFAALARRYENVFIDLAYQIVDLAKDIAERDGEYQTVYPNKDGTREIDLPYSRLLNNPFIIRCFDTSMLPKEPAGKLARITEQVQAGMLTVQEGRRLISYPDLSQEEKLANAGEERILQVLDKIVEFNDYNPPDPFMDLALAELKVVQYINLYGAANLEESKMESLRTFFSQIQALKQASMPPAPQQPVNASPQGVPEARPVSDILPNAPQGMGQ